MIDAELWLLWICILSTFYMTCDIRACLVCIMTNQPTCPTFLPACLACCPHTYTAILTYVHLVPWPLRRSLRLGKELSWDPITGLPPGWRRCEFFENELGENVDSIKKLMKLVCDRTGEDVEQLTQQSMAIHNARARASEESGPKAQSSPNRSNGSGGKLDPETFLPAGWVQVEKKYKTGTKTGKTYIRFRKEHGDSSNYCTITQVLKQHLEDTGEDLMPLYHELREQKLSRGQARSRIGEDHTRAEETPT